MASKQWGGRREGAGRKTEDGAAGLVKVTVVLTGDTIDKATELGGGNISLGLRKMLSNLPAPQSATKVDIPKKAAKKEYRQHRVVAPYPTTLETADGYVISFPALRRLQAEWREKYPGLSPEDY